MYNGKRRHKSDGIFSALGDTDELNACIGVAREHCTADVVGKNLPERLVEIQSRLLDIGSTIATPLDTSTPEQLERVSFNDTHVQFLEQWIDDMDSHLPPLRNFVLPVSSTAAGQNCCAPNFVEASNVVIYSQEVWQVPICTSPALFAAALSAPWRSLLTSSRLRR